MPDTKTETKVIECDVIATPNGYGFGQDWQLEIVERGPGSKIYRVRQLWLGQAEKVAQRLIGVHDMGQLIDETIAAGVPDNWNDRKCREYVASRIVEAIVLRLGSPTEAEVEDFLFTCEPWAVGVE